jgi:hypothetical protein
LKPRRRLLLLSILALIAVGGAFLLTEVLVLRIVNTDRARIFQIIVTPASRFTLSYIHSIYLEPAAEEFEVGEGEEMVLTGVRTQSPAVAHYYGFEDGREYYPVNRRMKSFVLRLGMSVPQTFTFQNQKISLQELGNKGERLEVKVVRMRLARYWFSKIFSAYP